MDRIGCPRIPKLVTQVYLGQLVPGTSNQQIASLSLITTNYRYARNRLIMGCHLNLLARIHIHHQTFSRYSSRIYSLSILNQLNSKHCSNKSPKLVSDLKSFQSHCWNRLDEHYICGFGNPKKQH